MSELTEVELAAAARELLGEENFKIVSSPEMDEFSQHYAATKNLLEAYTKAGLWAEGQSTAEARKSASKLRTSPAAQERIEYYRSMLGAMAHISLAEIVTSLRTAAQFDILDVMNSDGTLRQLDDRPEPVRRCVQSVDRKPGPVGQEPEFKIKMMDRNKALDSLIRLDSLERGTAAPTIVIGLGDHQRPLGPVIDA